MLLLYNIVDEGYTTTAASKRCTHLLFIKTSTEPVRCYGVNNKYRKKRKRHNNENKLKRIMNS
jgi:hypothetical protein